MMWKLWAQLRSRPNQPILTVAKAIPSSNMV
ncbi:hypothetical protein L914_05698 [Phytophthora nicotianae]|uniref:Uncharacterized protein n=1 Tax=Phytophthora nicotianae TaxID=4792 RepID=W2NNQ8_PHYNI|nr:hypothetical protein L914_05698 [Phytophthora nicotianae]